MILIWLLIAPAAGAILAWLLGRRDPRWSRWVSLLALAAQLAIVIYIGVHAGRLGLSPGGPWLEELNVPWIPQTGISFHLAMDGLSLLMVGLTAFLGLVSVAASWNEIQDRVGFFHFNLLWVLFGITGVFIALDLFLFYYFWEMMLVPSYFLFYWGYERRFYAAVKFFIFTQVSGLLMLLAILGLVFVHSLGTGTVTFDYSQLLGTPIAQPLASWLMLGFLIAFAVKLPVVPFHSWQPDAYAQSPTAATVILAGVMSKTGGYGLLRFVVPLFPGAAFGFATFALALAVVGILYGALLAFGQKDLKRLIAYSSIGHMGFVLLGVFAWNELALQGVVMTMVAHGITTGALFILVGQLQERTGTRDMTRLGGLWATVPRMSGVTLLFALAALGLPGLGNFVGEFLVLVGTFRANIAMAVAASAGIVAAVIYALWFIQRTFQGPNEAAWNLPDLSTREGVTMGIMVATIVWLGLYPQPVLNTFGQSLNNLQRYAGAGRAEVPQEESVVVTTSVVRTSLLGTIEVVASGASLLPERPASGFASARSVAASSAVSDVEERTTKVVTTGDLPVGGTR